MKTSIIALSMCVRNPIMIVDNDPCMCSVVWTINTLQRALSTVVVNWRTAKEVVVAVVAVLEEGGWNDLFLSLINGEYSAQHTKGLLRAWLVLDIGFLTIALFGLWSCVLRSYQRFHMSQERRATRCTRWLLHFQHIFFSSKIMVCHHWTQHQDWEWGPDL